jgi:hypothetical protein
MGRWLSLDLRVFLILGKPDRIFLTFDSTSLVPSALPQEERYLLDVRRRLKTELME